MDELKTFTNIDDEDFTGMYGGQSISVKAGETKPFTERIAKHLAKQLAYKILARKADSKTALDLTEQDKIAASTLGSLTMPVEIPKVEEIKEEVKTEEKEFEDLKPKKRGRKTKK